MASSQPHILSVMLLNYIPHFPTSPISTVTSWPKQRTVTTAFSLAFCLFSCPSSAHFPHRVPVTTHKSSPSHSSPSHHPVALRMPQIPSSVYLFVCFSLPLLKEKALPCFLLCCEHLGLPGTLQIPSFGKRRPDSPQHPSATGTTQL